MKLLVDANLSPLVAARLTEAGYAAAHVRDHGMLSASDEAIADFATAGGYVIVSADSDFATMLALGGHVAPSLVLMRSIDKLAPSDQASMLVANLPAVQEHLTRGAVVSIANGHLRVRELPLRRT